MAISHLAPASAPEPLPHDLMTIQQIVALLRESEYPAGETTVRNWITQHRIPRHRYRGIDYVSYSDVLPVQKEMGRRAGLNP